MKFTHLILAGLIVLPVAVSAQSKADSDAILDMCGCYAITFEFAETFASDTNYTFRDNYTAAATEWVQPVEVVRAVQRTVEVPQIQKIPLSSIQIHLVAFKLIQIP